MSNFDREELRTWATVVAAGVALLVFLVNSFFQVRNRRLENVARFIDAHQRLFAWDGYIAIHISLIETILTVVTERERNNVSWELVFRYLDSLAKDYTAYEGLKPEQRARFWR